MRSAEKARSISSVKAAQVVCFQVIFADSGNSSGTRKRPGPVENIVESPAAVCDNFPQNDAISHINIVFLCKPLI